MAFSPVPSPVLTLGKSWRFDSVSQIAFADESTEVQRPVSRQTPAGHPANEAGVRSGVTRVDRRRRPHPQLKRMPPASRVKMTFLLKTPLASLKDAATGKISDIKRQPFIAAWLLLVCTSPLAPWSITHERLFSPDETRRRFFSLLFFVIHIYAKLFFSPRKFVFFFLSSGVCDLHLAQILSLSEDDVILPWFSERQLFYSVRRKFVFFHLNLFFLSQSVLYTWMFVLRNARESVCYPFALLDLSCFSLFPLLFLHASVHPDNHSSSHYRHDFTPWHASPHYF